MIIEQKQIVAALIGLVVGAVGMGLIDANRPEPLFSSANESAEFCAEALNQLADARANIGNVNSQVTNDAYYEYQNAVYNYSDNCEGGGDVRKYFNTQAQ